jgi:integrase
VARRAVPNHPATLADLGRLWTGYGQKGRDATSVLTQWLEGLKNENTKRSYRTAVLEFWQWSSNDRSGVVPLPDRVTEAEAARFVDYLATRRYGMEQYRLDRDRERQLDARIYRYVKDHPGARFEEIRIDAGVARDAAGDLDQHLGRLVQERLLTRQPTLAELRRTPDGARAQLDGRVDPGLFTYRVPKRADARQSTLATRVAGLASLWSALGLPNPWTTWATTLKPKVAAERSSRRQAPMDEALLEKLLQTTVRPDGRASPQDLRDRAAILLLASCGLHVNELGRIRQSDWTGAELVITNADGEIRTVQLPNVLQQILTAFLERLQSIEDRRVRQGRPPIHSVAPDAPLLPVLKRWGKTTQFPASSERGITRSGLAMVLRQRAQRAGLEPGSEEFRKVHPSALRTLRGKLGTTVSQAAT